MNIKVPNEIEVMKLKHYDNYNNKNLKTHKGYAVDIIQFSVENIIFICAYSREKESLELIHYIEHSIDVGFGLLIDKYDDELYDELSVFVSTNQELLISKIKLYYDLTEDRTNKELSKLNTFR